MKDPFDDHPGFTLTLTNGVKLYIGQRPDNGDWFMSHADGDKYLHLANFVDASRAMAFIGLAISKQESAPKKRKRLWF